MLLRLVTLWVLCLATPGVTDVAQDLLSHATGVECCDEGGCDDGSGQCDPTECMHCLGCAHGSVVTTIVPTSVMTSPISREQRYVSSADRPHASGFRAPPFRPPAA